MSCSWGLGRILCITPHHTHCCTLCIQWATYLILSYPNLSHCILSPHTCKQGHGHPWCHVRVSTDPSFKISTLSLTQSYTHTHTHHTHTFLAHTHIYTLIHTPLILTRLLRIHPSICPNGLGLELGNLHFILKMIDYAHVTASFSFATVRDCVRLFCTKGVQSFRWSQIDTARPWKHDIIILETRKYFKVGMVILSQYYHTVRCGTDSNVSCLIDSIKV